MLEPSSLAAIEDLERRWLACELAGRVCDVLELCFPDIIWLPPGQSPICGKGAIHAWLERSRNRVMDISLSSVAVDGDSREAYKIASYRTRFVPDGSTECSTVTGWHLWILRRDAASAWRVAVVAWSLY